MFSFLKVVRVAACCTLLGVRVGGKGGAGGQVEDSEGGWDGPQLGTERENKAVLIVLLLSEIRSKSAS